MGPEWWVKAARKALHRGICGIALGLTGPAQAAQTAVTAQRPFEGSFWTWPAGSEVAAVDLTQSCGSAGDTPLCALKTYLACVLYDAPHLCAAVGLDKVPKRYAGANTLDAAVLSEPWHLSFEQLMPEAFAVHAYDGAAVPGSRFQVPRRGRGGYDPLPGYGAGAYELLMDIPEPYVKGLVYRLSFFFRPTDRGWHLIAWSSSREKACDGGFGTAGWAPCRWFIKNLRLRDVFARDVKPIWEAAKTPGHDDYPYPGLEIMSGMPNEPVVAPFDGTIISRSLKYPDMPLYDWVVVRGENRTANMTVKYAFVDRTGPAAGDHVEAATPLGKPEWLENEYAGAGRFVHMELLRDGLQIDPRTVMRERKAQDGAN